MQTVQQIGVAVLIVLITLSVVSRVPMLRQWVMAEA
jgi:hypothetical protein